ncbi:TolB family protein [Muricauda sp. CAU 1633]|uniref:DPP IV N-terminal domain-containing protein n=1 Tax=Allomuricauda sp. CAU 1633 TaxID=2816036 RepID=UPI001A8F235D|nr:DPP IV N-terminal domain-containing protein [Muricauda sp. CAU 1633]MBO0321423.1 TolB family protein [Muricauda sp. CAU 1633]
MKIMPLIFLIAHLVSAQDTIVYEAPVWSPSGNHVCYISNLSGATEIYLQDIEHGTLSKLTDDGRKKWTPSWSPDGSKIAFVSEKDENKELFFFDIATQATKRITNTPSDESMPSWNPNSESILYINAPKDAPNQIMETTLDGKTKILLQNPDTTYIYPSLSPDKKHLLYCYKPVSGEEQFHIAILNLKSGEETALESLGYVSYNPSWACDGAKIVFVNQEVREIASARIFMMALDGSSKEKIMTCEGGCFQPKMDPACTKVLFRDGWKVNHKGIFVYDITIKKITKRIAKSQS